MKFSTLLSLATAAGISPLNTTGTISASPKSKPSKPNVIYILADDLGYGDLGCYGQKYIKTPNLDRMAAEGILFTRHYAGCSVSAPSRSSLMTGLHTGHTYIRGNKEVKPEGQEPLNAASFTMAEMYKQKGYITGAFGKWGLGMSDSEGSPNKQGFDEFFGYLCQRYAHRYYPDYLWHNNKKVILPGNGWKGTQTYAPDVIQEKALEFIKTHKDTSFFLYVPNILPHAEVIAPDDKYLAMYKDKFEEKSWNGGNGAAYGGPDFNIAGYAPQSFPKAVFAAMVSRLDAQVGEIIKLVKDLGIENNTLIIFSSDNGPHQEGGADPDFFNSNGGFRGYKRDLYEGGIRVPMIARWPSKISAGSRTDFPSAFWDVMPTLAEIAGMKIPDGIDGISMVPTLFGKKGQKKHEYLYWEFHELGGRQAVSKGDWKLVCYNVLKAGETKVELYNLKTDPKETSNVAAQNVAVVAELKKLIKTSRDPSDIFKFHIVEY